MEKTRTKNPARNEQAGSPRFASVDAEAERAVLAAVLTSPEAFSEVSELLGAEDFGIEAHADVYRAVVAADAAGRPVDAIVVADELRRAKRLTRVGGIEFLDDLCGLGRDVVNVEAHAGIVAEKALLRRLVDTGRQIAGHAMDPGVKAQEALEDAERKVFELGRNTGGSTLAPMAQAVALTMQELSRSRTQALLGHPTGFVELDALCGGFQAGQLIVIAARPSMGKSALALQMARHIAETTGLIVPFLSYEMSTIELTSRMLASAVGIDVHKLRQGELPPGAERDVAVAAEKLAACPLMIDDNPPTTISGVRSQMRRLARRGEVGAVFVDYLQLLDGDSRGRDANRTQEVSDISRGLKRLGTELGVPVIALSQLNRQVEQRPNKRPVLSDLRESGSIEQDASLVAFLYRDIVYNPNASPDAAELLIAKQRNGRAGVSLDLVFDARCARFRNAPTALGDGGVAGAGSIRPAQIAAPAGNGRGSFGDPF